MKFFIDSHALEQLGHPDLDTRQKSLSNLISILQNNIFFEAQSNNCSTDELQVVNLAELAKQLIRWFRFKPITNSEEVLDLLILILRRRDFLSHITKSISVARLKKEMIKIAQLLLSKKTAIKFQILEQVLTEFENSTNASHSVSSKASVRSESEDLIECFDNFGLEARDDDEEAQINSQFWGVLEGSDLEFLTALDCKLLLYQEKENFKHSLNFFRVIAEDFLPEYYLQPPFILETLMDIVWKVTEEEAIEILRIIRHILNGLKDRWLEAKNVHATYIPVKKHTNKILQIFTEFFDNFHDKFKAEYLTHHQEILNESLMLLFALADFIGTTHEVCEIYFNELLNMLGKITKKFRLENSRECRMNYLVCIYLINCFVASVDTSNIIKFSGENNPWELELDIALLDCSIKSLHEDLYNMVKENRSDIIKDDENINIILNVEKNFYPIVEIYQNWEQMSEDEIIFKGIEALNVIRIVKNADFVNVAFNAIMKSSEKFHSQPQLKQAAEELFVRLLSIEVPEIRSRAYKLACENVQRKISDECSDVRLIEMDLCAVFGIPMTPEIISEILCFGLLDENEEIQKSVQTILFALLRSKVIFVNHWERILEVIKPIFAMLPCLFTKDQKLGFFSLDVFNLNSNLTKDKLIQSFARFLFCTHPTARDMAKRKIFDLLDDHEFTQEFIEIIPDNFCIVEKSQVSDLQLPDGKIGYDHEAYSTTAQLLKSMSVHHDEEVLQSILLKLCVLMNSRKLCIKSHDDNLWVYFMSSLEMHFPNNALIRKLTINILYKWAVCISSFRMYLANEIRVLQFLINTLIFYQDDQQIKRQTSSLLFLILFSDFVVVNEKVTSLPNILSTLECPFRFKRHWVESPFNKYTRIESFYERVEEDDDSLDSKQISSYFMRFSFAKAWFKDSMNGIENAYYKNLSKKTLKVPKKLMLTDEDYQMYRNTSTADIVSYFCSELENSTKIDHRKTLFDLVTCIQMLPQVKLDKFAVLLEEKLRKFSIQSHLLKISYLKHLELYETLIPSLSDAQIISIIKGDSCISPILKCKNFDDQIIYAQLLSILNRIIKVCVERHHITNKVIKSFNDEFKVHFSPRVVEKLFENFFDNYTRNRKMSEIVALPTFRMILTTLKNALSRLPIVLDEPFLNATFQKMLDLTKHFLSSPSTNLKNSHVMHQIFAIINRICELSFKINLQAENYKTIFLWLNDREKKNKALIWKVVAQLTKQNLHFVEFCKGFESALDLPLYEVLTKAIANENSIHEKNAQALMIGNYLDCIAEDSQKELKLTVDKKSVDRIKIELAEGFIRQNSNCVSAVSFVVKKMIQHNMKEVTDIVIQKRLIEVLLENSVENLDTIVICYNFKDLEKHVVDAVGKISDETFVQLIDQLESQIDSVHKKQKKINRNIFDVILILIQTPKGCEKIRHHIFEHSQRLNDFVLIISHGLQHLHEFTGLMFFLEVILAFLNSSDKTSTILFSNQELMLLDCNHLVKMSEILLTDTKGKPQKKLNSHFMHVQYAVDLFVYQIAHILNHVDWLQISEEHKLEVKAVIYLLIMKILECSEQGQIFASKIKILDIIVNKASLLLMPMLENVYAVATKMDGVIKCKLRSKELCVYLRAISDWKLKVDESKTQEILKSLIRAFSWVEADAILMNNFINFLRKISSLEVIKICTSLEFNGTTFAKFLLKKAQTFSLKSPHTDGIFSLLKNLMNLFESFTYTIEMRLMLRNVKFHNFLEQLHPHLQKNRRSSWNEVTLVWMKFFESLSKFDDIECNPGQISLFCRLIRLDDAEIGNVALKTIRNFAMKSSIGYVVLASNDFMETVDAIFIENGGNAAAKLLILQTLLSIASTSEQMRSKMKNSPLSRKLKDQLSFLQNVGDDNCQVLSLSTMLSDILYA